MIVINLDPTLFSIGSFALTWHGLFTAAGILVTMGLASRLANQVGISGETAVNLALWALPGGFIGARLFHVAGQFAYYQANPGAILTVQEGGLSVYGGLAGGILAVALYASRKGLPLGRFMDAVAPALILGQAVGRIGNLISGAVHGTPARLPWAVVYDHPKTLGEHGISVHPAVGYEMLWDLSVFTLLLLLRKRFSQPGTLFWVYIALYSLGRFVTGIFRRDTIVFAALSQDQLAAVVSLVAASFAFTLLATRRTEQEPITEALASADSAMSGAKDKSGN